MKQNLHCSLRSVHWTRCRNCQFSAKFFQHSDCAGILSVLWLAALSLVEYWQLVTAIVHQNSWNLPMEYREDPRNKYIRQSTINSIVSLFVPFTKWNDENTVVPGFFWRAKDWYQTCWIKWPRARTFFIIDCKHSWRRGGTRIGTGRSGAKNLTATLHSLPRNSS